MFYTHGRYPNETISTARNDHLKIDMCYQLTNLSITVQQVHLSTPDIPSKDSPAARTVSSPAFSPPLPPSPVPQPTPTSDSTAPTPTLRIYAAPLATMTVSVHTQNPSPLLRIALLHPSTSAINKRRESKTYPRNLLLSHNLPHHKNRNIMFPPILPCKHIIRRR
jgi:hypothetical protein